MNNFLTTIAALVFFVLSGSANADLSDSSLVPKKEAAFAGDYLQKLRERSFEHVKLHLAPELKAQVTDQKLEEVARYFPPGKLISAELVGSQTHTSPSAWQGNFSFEYQFEGGWALANVVLKRAGEGLSVVDFGVYRTDGSQRELNKFVLQGKSPWHYAILTLALAVPLFIIITLIVCVRTPIPRRKWLWVIFILGGIGSVGINWTTGALEFNLLQYLVLGGSALASSEHAPWVITAGFPLGALIFWFKRRKFIALSLAAKSEQAAPGEGGATAAG